MSTAGTRVLGWCLNLVYAALLAGLSPLLVWKRITQGKYRRGWREKLLGTLPERTGDLAPRVWFHAVSVGEVLLLKTIVRELRQTRPDVELFVTTTTETGYDVATQQLPGCTVSWLPLDFTWAVRRAVRRVRPDAFVLVELELWPNLLRAVSDAGIPLLLVNGRLGEKSFHGYRRLKFLFGRLLRRFDSLGVQSPVHAERFRTLGAGDHAVVVTGSVKFDGAETNRDNPRTKALGCELRLAPDEPVFIAGSTQAPEEELALATWQELLSEIPRLRLILVPRHRERFDAVAELVTSKGCPLLRRSVRPAHANSAVTAPTGDPRPVILLDTLGELSACWGLASVAFVGGSLTGTRGGQNMIEPAAYGVPVLFGPHTENFRVVVESLLAVDAARVVREGSELTAAVRTLLMNSRLAAEMGRRGRDIVVAQQGATRRAVELIVNALPDHLTLANRAAA